MPATATRPAGVRQDHPHRACGLSRVLCIDDDWNILEGLKRRFRRAGMEMLRAANGRHGYWLAVEKQPDVIISDLRMPDGSGHWVISRLKADPRTAHIPIVVLTGLHNPTLATTACKLGAEKCLYKPVRFQRLLRELRPYLRFEAKD